MRTTSIPHSFIPAGWMNLSSSSSSSSSSQVAMFTMRPNHVAIYNMLLRQLHECLINFDCLKMQMHLLWLPKYAHLRIFWHLYVVFGSPRWDSNEGPACVLMTIFMYSAMIAGTLTRLFAED